MTEKLARRGLKVPEDYEAAALKVVRVGEVMRKDVQAGACRDDRGGIGGAPSTEREALRAKGCRRTSGEISPKGCRSWEKTGDLRGIVTQGDLLRAMENDPRGKVTVLEAGSEQADRGLSRRTGARCDVSHAGEQYRAAARGQARRSGEDGGLFQPVEPAFGLVAANAEEGVREHGWIRSWRNARNSDDAAGPRVGPGDLEYH